MKLQNNFPNEDKMRCWLDHPFCVLCGSNQGCALHHIDGRSSKSMYNSSMLCHVCHKKADAHNTSSPQSLEFRNKLRAITKRVIDRTSYVPKDYDREYLDKYKTD